jgi:hypothetical protein
MSCRGNCHDNAVAKNFSSPLKRKRTRRKIYRTCHETRSDVFDYIDMFYNPKSKSNGIVNLFGLVVKGAMLTELYCFQFTGDIMPHAVSIGSDVAI